MYAGKYVAAFPLKRLGTINMYADSLINLIKKNS